MKNMQNYATTFFTFEICVQYQIFIEPEFQYALSKYVNAKSSEPYL
jgi:hypothetical protein